jgi:hypothetical protein
MVILAFFISFILLVLATIHMLWGFGYWFPMCDEADLVRVVVGAKDVDRMPGPIPCGLVSALLLVVLIVLWSEPHWARTLILGIAALAFISRGMASYTVFWRKMTPQEPFATYDRRYYGPLCVVLAMGVLALQWGGF